MSALTPSFNLCLTSTSSHVTAQTRLPLCLFNYHFSSFLSLSSETTLGILPWTVSSLQYNQVPLEFSLLWLLWLCTIIIFSLFLPQNPLDFIAILSGNSKILCILSPPLLPLNYLRAHLFANLIHLKANYSPISLSQTCHLLISASLTSYEWLTICFSTSTGLKQACWYSLVMFFHHFLNHSR